MADQQFWDDVKTGTVGALQLFGAYSAVYSYVNATGKLVKTIAALEMLNESTRLFMNNPKVQAYFEQQSWGADFLTAYNALSTGVDILTISTAVVTAFRSHADDVRNVLKSNNVGDDALDEFDRVVSKAKGGGQILKKVALGSDDMSQFAVNFRKTLAIPNHRGNVAVFEYVDNSGKLVKKAFTTEIESELHSEEIAIDFFKSNKIPNSNIKRIYSELEPCELERHTCKQNLNNYFPEAVKTYSYPYPGRNNVTQDILDIRKLSIQERFNDLQNLLK
jgi:hypothetical protein